ncbi:MFS transporter [Aspergillus fischeri NRRL 181]|uniref:MFS transporter, putative n=1 Tax=Neosartorya fischeri (strain ATCC 1020 / DSM 3700 / CBS 544.65 / FGSC A1164 / JCM 1740 / NRRL 181 / WB 181) TaxID=331117 RepID=A1DGX8_NEOFI|nr:MFS transporter, putative [Aspergillus fischeri NRRL 181]EAW18635.1 MFS transporter, putative [Aspergillus fischeri NRRL 181]
MFCSTSKGRKRPPWLLQIRSSTAFIVATVWTSSFTDYFLYAMIVPVMPTALVDRAGVPYDEREYWVSVLLMCEAAVAFVCCPIFGYLVDIAPTRQFPYLFGLILLGASMGMLAVAHTVWLFIVVRLLQGGATAMVAVAGLALMTDSVSFDNLGQTIGYLGSSIALGFLLGPLLGGLVYNAAGYNAVFAMAFAIIGVDFVMRVAVIEKKVARAWLSDSPEENPREEYPQRSSQISETATGWRNIALLRIASQPRVMISSFALLVQGILYSAFDSTIPVFVEDRFGWSPFGAGIAFLPSAITALFEPYFGSISDRYGARLVTFTGFLLLSPPLISLRYVDSNTTPHIILLLSLLTLIGLFINACVPALYVETQQVLEEMERARPGIFGKRGAVAQAFGIQTMSSFMGMFLGPLWGGFVEYRFGWNTMAWTLGLLAAVTAVPMLWLSNGAPGEVVEGTERERERLLAGAEERGG